MQRFTIGQLADLTGVNAKTIRYYEDIGLLPRPEREANGYRSYNQADVNSLTLLRRFRLLGIPLAELKPLLTTTLDARCIEVQRELLVLIHARLAALDLEIAELHLLREQVASYQHQLAASTPNDYTLFRACRDLSCLAEPCETASEEEQHGTQHATI
jgi:MerR family transcriptional regulator, copper efflux regulator